MEADELRQCEYRLLYRNARNGMELLSTWRVRLQGALAAETL